MPLDDLLVGSQIAVLLWPPCTELTVAYRKCSRRRWCWNSNILWLEGVRVWDASLKLWI